jgi:hypothetical protein
MYSNEIKESVETQFKIKKVLWIGLTAGLILYLLAVYFVTAEKSPNNNLSIQTEYLFAAVGFILFILAIIVRKYSFSESKLNSMFSTGEIALEDTAGKINTSPDNRYFL